MFPPSRFWSALLVTLDLGPNFRHRLSPVLKPHVKPANYMRASRSCNRLSTRSASFRCASATGLLHPTPRATAPRSPATVRSACLNPPRTSLTSAPAHSPQLSPITNVSPCIAPTRHSPETTRPLSTKTFPTPLDQSTNCSVKRFKPGQAAMDYLEADKWEPLGSHFPFR